MNYYHLSQQSGLELIRPSSFIPTPSIIIPCVPQSCAEEDCDWEDNITRRVCIAPSVWQCIFGRGAIIGEYRLNVYMATITCPTDPGIASHLPPRDLNFTKEKWITDKDIEKNGGKIRLSYEGFVVVTVRLEWQLRKLQEDGKLIDGEDHIWRKEPDGEWKQIANCGF